MILPFQTSDEISAAIPLVRAHLERDGVLGYPTETVYGLGTDARDAALAAWYAEHP